jgi:hypothetical protein
VPAAKRKKRRKKQRQFRLAPPGKTIHLSYVLVTRSERMWSLASGIIMSVIGTALLASRSGWLGGLALAVGVVILLVLMAQPKRGTLALDDETLEIGPDSKTRRIALANITGTSRVKISSIIPDARESWVVFFSDPASKSGAPSMAVGLLDPHDADEIGTRLALRMRALEGADPRAFEALEVHYEAGEEAIGVQLTSDGWRAFFSLDELEEVSGQPFRDRARIPLCMRADVWDAFQSASPELARRFELTAGLS